MATTHDERRAIAGAADALRYMLTRGPTYHVLTTEHNFVAAHGLVELGLMRRDGWASNGRARFVRTTLGEHVARALGADVDGQLEALPHFVRNALVKDGPSEPSQTARDLYYGPRLANAGDVERAR